MRILLVDDNREIRSTLTTFLQGAGHEVHACHDAQVAWSLLQEGKEGESAFELVITDIQMPTMDGVELATPMRAHGSQAPIIFIAGGIEAELEQPRADFGTYRVLHKPFMMSAFLDVVSEVEGAASAS